MPMDVNRRLDGENDRERREKKIGPAAHVQRCVAFRVLM
jgi:hypothetical protein